ncbi:MAG: SPOR domain-containing protein [Nitrosomonas sp.]|nr:SPOR domain-containing protein [Nitrosomonas sp.]
MKKIFSFLLIVNILFAMAMLFKFGQPKQGSNSPALNPEKIVVLPALVNCTEWGDFSDQQLQLAETAIGKLNLQLPFKLISSASVIKYRVNTLPFEDQQTVEREINKLRNMGIISHRIQENGPWLNAISFGEFDDNAAALDMQKKLNDSGITHTTIEEYESAQKKFVFIGTDATKITELHQLITQFSDSRLVHTTCERL